MILNLKSLQWEAVVCCVRCPQPFSAIDSQAALVNYGHRCVLRFAPLQTSSHRSTLRTASMSLLEGNRVPRVPKEASAAERFSELVRAMADQESEAALAVFFNNSVTTITNWSKGLKLPKDRDIEDLVKKCGISLSELQPVDELNWRSTLNKVLSTTRVLVTPGWLHQRNSIFFIEEHTESHTIFIITADAYNDTQRKEVQGMVRRNIARGVNYVYIIPSGCQNERSLIRFVENTKTLSTPSGHLGTAIILKARATKSANHEWKRIDNVMLFAHGDTIFKIKHFADIPFQLDQIDEGYEQLYQVNDQPYGDYVWKSLSIREIDYYKELLEEWTELDTPENDASNA
jgi:hypothetical protein